MSRQQYDLIEMLDHVKVKVNQVEADIGLHHNFLSTHGGNLSKIDAQIETQLRKTIDLQTEMQDYKNDYVAMKKFDKEIEEFERKYDRLQIQLEDQINTNQGLHNFVEKYIPLKTQNMISECLNGILGEREKKKLTEYEKIKYASLNQIILRDDGI